MSGSPTGLPSLRLSAVALFVGASALLTTGADAAAAEDGRLIDVLAPWPSGDPPLADTWAGLGAGPEAVAGAPGPGHRLTGTLLSPLPAIPASPAPPPALWTRPVADFPVSAAYGVPGSWLAGHHTGVDYALPTGTPVRSVGPGTVETAGWAGDYGNAVLVRMADGHRALYAHLSRVDVEEGQRTEPGTLLGASGSTGRSTGPHLHFEVRTGRHYGTDTDPLAYLRRHGVRPH